MSHNARPHDEDRADSPETQCQDAVEQFVNEFRQRAERRQEKATSLFTMERSRHLAAATAYENAADMLENQVLRK